MCGKRLCKYISTSSKSLMNFGITVIANYNDLQLSFNNNNNNNNRIRRLNENTQDSLRL